MITKNSPIKLFMVDDHLMMIEGIKSLLHKEQSIDWVGDANSAAAALRKLEHLQIDILITDFSMPEMDGVQLTKIIKEKFPTVKVLALSMFDDAAKIKEMIDAGVNGYILKNTGKEELLTAIHKIADGATFYSTEVSMAMMKSLNDTKSDTTQVGLTTRELEVIQLIAKEFSNAQIADQLFISERTVETHRKNIFRKTNTKTVIGLIQFAIQHKLI